MVAPSASAKCSLAFEQAFRPYEDEQTYSVDDAVRDFPATKGPYKMISGGDQGEPTTMAEETAIRAFYPKGS